MTKDTKNRIACIECDLLLTYSGEVGEREHFECPRCRHILVRGSVNPEDTVLALAFTALMALIVSVCFSFLSFEVTGQANTVSLLGVGTQLYLFGFGILTAVVFAFMVVLPFAYLSALLLLTLQAKTAIRTISSRALAKLAAKIYPWIMVDVFIFGVLVALVKIMGMAEVTLGISFWSYVIFTFLFIRISLVVDTHRLWSWADNGH